MNVIDFVNWYVAHQKILSAMKPGQTGPGTMLGGVAPHLGGGVPPNVDAAAAAKEIGNVIASGIDDVLRNVVNKTLPVNLRIPVYSDWRREIRALEFCIVMVMVWEFIEHQSIHFRGLNEASGDGYRRMMNLLQAAPKLRDALTTLFLNTGKKSAHRFVLDLKAKAPKEFWELLWITKA